MDFHLVWTCICAYLFINLIEKVDGLPEYYVEDHCSQTLALNFNTVEAVRLQLTKTEKYPDGMRCAMRIQAPEGKRLFILFEDFDVHGIPDLQCQSGDFIQFFDGPNEGSINLGGLPQRVCQAPQEKKYVTSGRFLVIRVFSDTDMISGRGLKLSMTAFNEAPCVEGQYQCQGSGHCIQKSLECDGSVNCMDESDESLPKCMSVAAIAGIAVGGGIVLIIIIVVIVVLCFTYRRRKRARMIKRSLAGHSYPSSIWDDTAHQNDENTIIDDVDGSTVQPYRPPSDLRRSGDTRPSHDINEVIMRRNTSTFEDRHRGPDGKAIRKVPSGFWDITMDDLQLTPTTEV